MSNKDFYIGWIGEAPRPYALFVKKFIAFLIPAVVIISLLLAVSQKKFGKGNFEFGTLTELKGVFGSKPFPHLKVIDGRDVFGNNDYITVPLVGYGKFGAEGIISESQQQLQQTLDGKMVTMKGTLFYNDGKVLMQIDGNDKPVGAVTNFSDASELTKEVDLGNIMLKGEIVDPKCFFGVMKPGEGKPHKDCAIRCILGGIPPVLRVKDNDGNSNYYMISVKANQSVKNFVGRPVKLTAHAVQYNDWIVLFPDESSKIDFISGRSFYQESEEVACATRSGL